MTKEYLTIGSSPCDEPCAQVGSNNYSRSMRMETRALINQMERIHPSPTDDHASFNAYYTVKSFPHDFGSYHEVCVVYDPDHEPSIKWAMEAESLLPEKWDSQAKNELTSMDYEYPTEE